MRVRAARADELVVCAALFANVAEETFGKSASLDMTAEFFLASSASEEVFIAIEDEQPLGLLSLYRPEAFVHFLFVRDRGRGVGAALLRHAQASVETPLSLKVATANVHAIRFYHREGFTEREQGDDGRGPWVRMTRVQPSPGEPASTAP